MDKNDKILLQFDEITKELKELAEKKKIDLGLIRITNHECEKIRKRYEIFYN